MDSAAAAQAQLEQVGTLPLGCDPMDPTYKQQAVALLQRITRR